MSRPASARAPKFGAWLRQQRGSRSLEQIAIKIRPSVSATGLKVDQSLLYKIEQGRVPSWPMLAALSQVYGISPMEAARRLMATLEFPGAGDLLRQDTALDSAGGNADALTGTETGPRFDGEQVFGELAEAAFAFDAISIQCAQWRDRLTELAADHGKTIVTRQVATARADAAHRARHRGKTDRPTPPSGVVGPREKRA